MWRGIVPFRAAFLLCSNAMGEIGSSRVDVRLDIR